MFGPTKDVFTRTERATGSLDDLVLTGRSASAQQQAFDVRPWEDPTRQPAERKLAYENFILEKLERINSALDRLKGDDARQNEILQAPETTQLIETMKALENMSPGEFCRQMDNPEKAREILGKNFLGAEAWRSLMGLDVGSEPPIPASIARAMLNADFKDNFLLVLLPATVNGVPYTPLAMDMFCRLPLVGGASLIYQGWDWWKSSSWASTPQAESEWVLMPIREPDAKGCSSNQSFRGKSIAAQAELEKNYYADYRQAKAIEVMTAAILDGVVNGGSRVVAGGANLRTVEPSSCGGQVTISQDSNGVKIADFYVGLPNQSFGRALAWKL